MLNGSEKQIAWATDLMNSVISVLETEGRKMANEKAPTYRATITVYYKFDNAEIEQRHCQCCQEAHSLFYCNKNYNCNRCEYKAYMVRAEERARLMKQAGREKLRDNQKK